MSSSKRKIDRNAAKRVEGANKAVSNEYNDCMQICEVYIPKALEVSDNIKEVIKIFEELENPTDMHKEILADSIEIDEELDGVLPTMVKSWNDMKENKPPFKTHDAMETMGDIEIIYSGKLVLMDVHSRYALMVENKMHGSKSNGK